MTSWTLRPYDSEDLSPRLPGEAGATQTNCSDVPAHTASVATDRSMPSGDMTVIQPGQQAVLLSRASFSGLLRSAPAIVVRERARPYKLLGARAAGPRPAP